MTDWLPVFLGPLASALFLLTFLLLRDVNWQWWSDLFRRGVKYARVTWRQMDEAARQQYAVRAVIVVFFVWWSVAIVTGMP